VAGIQGHRDAAFKEIPQPRLDIVEPFLRLHASLVDVAGEVLVEHAEAFDNGGQRLPHLHLLRLFDVE
jgi:hypothetical protein